MNRARSSSEWAGEIVYLRGLAVLSVIFFHATLKLLEFSGHLSGPQLILVFLNGMIMGHPSFIFASGFVLSRIWFKHPGDWKRFYTRRLRSIVPPFLFFSIVYFFASGRYHGQEAFQFASDLAVSIWRCDTAYHLWFIFNIIQLYLLLPVICSIFDAFERKGRIRWFLALALALHTSWLVYCILAKIATPAMGFQEPTVTLAEAASQRLFLASLFYFCLGVASGRRYDRLEYWMGRVSMRVVLAANLIVGGTSLAAQLYGVELYGNYYFIRSNTLLLYLLLSFFGRILFVFLLLKIADHFKNRSSWPESIVGQFGKYSFGIYLIHILFLDALTKILVGQGVDPGNRFYYLLTITGTAFLSFVSVRVLSLLPHSQYLIGQTLGRGPRG